MDAEAARCRDAPPHSSRVLESNETQAVIGKRNELDDPVAVDIAGREPCPVHGGAGCEVRRSGTAIEGHQKAPPLIGLTVDEDDIRRIAEVDLTITIVIRELNDERSVAGHRRIWRLNVSVPNPLHRGRADRTSLIQRSQQ